MTLPSPRSRSPTRAALVLALLILITPAGPGILVVLTALSARQVQAAPGIASGPDNAPDIIAGQARTPPPARPAASSREAPADFHAKALAPLPAQTYPRRPKRARKHRLDEDRDGFVSRSEFEADHHQRAAAFRMADVNQDGKLDSEEMRRYQSLMQGRSRRR